MSNLRIIDLQHRLREIGRIRIGEKVPTQSGKVRPSKIDVFRFTSRDEQVIRAAAERWGGSPEPWPDGPGGGQWQVRSTAAQIAVVIPPGDMSFSQAYEQWTAGGCKVRCDGRWDHIGDRACHCDPDDRDCNIHTRLSVILPDLPGLGVWRLESHGYYAAVELGGIVEICAIQSARGVMLPARLRIEWREVKRVIDGKVQTLKFAVPVLDLDVHPMALAAGADPGTGEIEAGVVGALPVARPALSPVPQVDGSAAPTVAEQMAAIDAQQPRRYRANAAEPVPSTGLRPRTVAEAAQGAEAEQGEPEPVREIAYNAGDIAKRAGVVFAADYEAAPRGKKTAVVDRLRHAAVWTATKQRTASSKECTPEELPRVMRILDDIAAGKITYRADALDDDAGVMFTLPRPGHAEGDKTVTVMWSEMETQPGPEVS